MLGRSGLTRLLEVGASAPDFALEGTAGGPHALRDVLARGVAALVFYPGDNTPG